MIKHILFTLTIIVTICAEKIRFISTEHPAVTYYNTNYISYANLTTKRYGRGDPFYYLGINVYTVTTFDNNVTMHLYFYEFLSNRYQRGFVEVHSKICDFFNKEEYFFGAQLRQGKLAQPCPYAPGEYNMLNLTLKQVPSNFPFKKGRIYVNMTNTATNEPVANGHIDMEIKLINIKKKTKK